LEIPIIFKTENCLLLLFSILFSRFMFHNEWMIVYGEPLQDSAMGSSSKPKWEIYNAVEGYVFFCYMHNTIHFIFLWSHERAFRPVMWHSEGFSF
ncbi:hypothetical protein ACJX0J_007297, partial [Zea mays]